SGNSDSSFQSARYAGTYRSFEGNEERMTPAAGDSKKIRVAVVGTGEFGRNHARVYRELDGAELVGVFDENPQRAAAVAAEFQTLVLTRIEELPGRAEAASVAVPTVAHAEVGRSEERRVGKGGGT